MGMGMGNRIKSERKYTRGIRSGISQYINISRFDLKFPPLAPPKEIVRLHARSMARNRSPFRFPACFPRALPQRPTPSSTDHMPDARCQSRHSHCFGLSLYVKFEEPELKAARWQHEMRPRTRPESRNDSISAFCATQF